MPIPSLTLDKTEFIPPNNLIAENQYSIFKNLDFFNRKRSWGQRAVGGEEGGQGAVSTPRVYCLRKEREAVVGARNLEARRKNTTGFTEWDRWPCSSRGTKDPCNREAWHLSKLSPGPWETPDWGWKQMGVVTDKHGQCWPNKGWKRWPWAGGDQLLHWGRL